MPKFKVSVEKRLYCTGTVEVTAKSANAAIDKVDTKIHLGKLTTTAINWSEPEYEDMSFGPTGDVD